MGLNPPKKGEFSFREHNIMKSHVAACAAYASLLSSSVVISSSFSAPTRFESRASSLLVVRHAQQRGAILVLRGGGSNSDSSSPVHANPRGIGAESHIEAGVPDDKSSHTVDHPISSSPTTVHGGGGDNAHDTVLLSSSSTTTKHSSSSSSQSRLGSKAPPPGPIRRLLPNFPWHVVPNYLTYARCLSIPIFLLLSYYPTTTTSTNNFPNRAPILSAIFAIASMTDWLDGYLARRWDIASNFGAFLDPVADKLMVSTALIVLAGRYGGIVAIPASIIMARELGVSALREWMAQKGLRDSVKVGMQGKVKAALTMVSLSLMLLVPEGVGLESVGWTKYIGSLGVGGSGIAEGTVMDGSIVYSGLAWMLGPSLLMLFLSAIITVTSGSVYFKAALPVLLGE